MVTMPEPSSWEASAYILRGQYCPKEQIRSTLASVMSALGGTQIIHIAFDQTTVIGGLCFSAGYSVPLGEKLEKLMSRADYNNTNARIVELCQEVATKTQSDSRVIPETLANDLVKAIADLRFRRGLSASDRSALVHQSYSGMYLNNTGSGNQGATGGIDSIILVNTKFRSPMPLLRRIKILSELAVELNSTPEATARNDEAVMRQVAERLHAADNEREIRQFERFASDALDLALDVTRSQGGAVYTISSERNASLNLVTSRSDLPFPKNLPPDHTGALGYVMSSNKTLQLHRWPLPRIGRTTPRAPDGTVLLSPIGGPGGDPTRPAIGVLLLFRRDVSSSFNAYDLALARNVTLRISLERTTDVMADIGAVTTALRATTDWVEIVERLRGDRDDLETLPVPLPTDVRAAAVRIEPFLREIAQLTDSLSVSLELALPLAAVNESHGLALVSVASFPRKPDDDRYPIHTENLGGLNWTCMRTGNFVYASDVNSKENYLRARERTVSEFSMPIRVEGLLIGVLNLESALHDAYSPFMPLIASFGGAVGRTFADARASLEQQVIDAAAQALNHRHSMESRLDDLADAIAARCDDKGVRPEFINLIQKIRQELIAMRQLPSTEDESETALSEILGRAITQVDYLGLVPEPTDYPILAAPITGHRVKLLQVAIANVLSNMMNYSAASRDVMSVGPLREIKVSEAELQGNKQAVLTFRNYADSYLDPERIANLYRCPVLGTGGSLRVGAFLAGLNARRSLARLHCGILADQRTLRTTLVIPLEGLVLCLLSMRTVFLSVIMNQICVM